MKFLFRLFSIVMLLVCSNTSQAQWTQLTTNTTENINCVRYAPSGDVWAGTWNGILRSSNSGATFNFVNGINATLGNSQIIGTFDDIHVTGSNTAVATGYFYLGNDLMIFGTVNNGASWSHNFYTGSGSLPRYISTMDFDGSVNGVAVGGAGRVYRSSNNGSIWTASTSGTTSIIEDVSWVNGSTFVSVSGTNIYRSTNNGVNWTSVLASQSGIENVSFARGTNTGYAGGSSTLKKSTDGGLTWTTLNVPPMNIRTIFTFSPDTVYLGTYDGVYRSVSGGTYWEKFDMPNVEWVNDIRFYDGNNGMVAGDSGYVAVTSNGGGAAMPVSFFTIPVGNNCEGGTLQPINQGNPAWAYQWWMNGTMVSTSYSPTLNLNQSGNVSVTLVASNNGFTDTSSFTVSVSPIPQVNSFTVVNDTICQNGQGHFRIPNSQLSVMYALFDGPTLITSQGGNGNTITLTTPTNQSVVKPYRIRGIFTNVCGADTLEVFDSLWIATPAANVSASLYRDTICTGDTTTMLIYNSEPGWDYYCSNAQFTKVDGNGGTIGIPIGPITSSINSFTVVARFKALNCLKTLPGTYSLTYRATSVSVPGTLQAGVGQPVTMSASSSGFNAWDWDFGPNSTPSTGIGQIPFYPVYSVSGIDTVTLTARLNFTCSKVIRKPVFIYGSLPNSSVITCSIDTMMGSIGNLNNEYHMDDYNNLHVAGYSAISGTFPFRPFITRIDTSGLRRYFTSYNSFGNSPGAQGLIHSITTDKYTNTYFSTNYKALNYYDIQGNYLRTRNALVKTNPNGKFQWAMESPLADFSDMVTVDDRIFAIGTNVWNGCEIQTPAGLFTYNAGISNRGDAFIMEINSQGEVLGFDAFGSGGNGGVSSPAKFRIKSLIVNQFFEYDTLRQNLMVKRDGNSALIIAGMLDGPSIASPVNFNSTVLSNALPTGISGEKSLFVARYDINTSNFTNAVTFFNGLPDLINDFVKLPNGHFVFTGTIRNRIVTSAGVFTFPTQNYNYQFLASFSPSGSLDWMVYADTMNFRSLAANADGSVTLMAVMTTKFLIVDALNTPYNVSPTPQTGTFLLRFGANGELLSADRTSNFTGLTMKQDACGNLHTFHYTSLALQSRVFHSVHSNSGSCGSNCYTAYDPNLLDAALDSVILSDKTTNGPPVRNFVIKVKSQSVVTVNSMQVRYHINNDAVQTLNWNGVISTGDSVIFTVNNYNFNKSYNRIRVWIQSVNGVSDDFPENDTIIQGQIICSAPLAGTYSIGCDTCYFEDIQKSATTLKTCGVSDPVTMAIEPGHYGDQIQIDSIPFANSSDTILWTSRTGTADDVVVSFKTDNTFNRSLFELTNASYCSFKHLTLRNLLPRSYDAMISGSSKSVFYMWNSDHININNCKLIGPTETGGVVNSGNIIEVGDGGNYRITNNFIQNGDMAINLTASFNHIRNVDVSDNTALQTDGFYFYHVDSLLISGNRLSAIGKAVSTKININECDSFRVVRNSVTSENWGDEVLNVYCNCPPANHCLIANNIFSSAPFWLPVAGAYINGTNLDVINNSFGHGIEIYTNGGFNFVNNLVRSNGSFAVDMSSPTFVNSFNYNRYQSVGAPINFKNNGNNYTLAGWRTLTGFDTQSDSVTAEYTTLTDMHHRSAVAMPGINWPGITMDIDGDPRGAVPTIGADEYSFNPLIGVVWPGDCDSSKAVDNFDLLPIGLYNNRFSTSRPNDPSTSWVAQPSLLWNDVQSSGINMNHADANGDGLINQNDTSVIITNYGLSHPIANPDPQRLTAGPDLAVVPVGTVYAAGDTVHLKIMAGNGVLPVDVLSAIGFQVTVPPGLIVPGSYAVTIANNWLCPDSNCIMYQRADETTGITAVSLARLDGDAVSAYGELADIQFVVNAAYTGNPTVTIPMSDYRAFDPAAAPISLSPVDGIIQVTNTSVEEFSLMDGVRLFPNPTKSLSTILFNWKGSGNDNLSVRVLDLSGRVVDDVIQWVPHYGVNSVEVDAVSFANGIYFIELRSNRDRKVLKMIKY
jgi:hypothetical protein